LLERAPSTTAKHDIALRAQAAHPVDYFYALAESAAEPIAPDASGRSARLHALNHALLLCPRCPDVHAAVASTLWALGRREQAVDEWHTAVETRPVVFDVLLQTICAAGARPEEIAAVAGPHAGRLIKAASLLLFRRQPDGARTLLPLIAAAGAPPEQVLILKAKLDIGAGATEEALKSLDAARKLSAQDAEVFLLLGQAHLQAGQVDEALQDLDTGIGMNPQNLGLLRSRLSLIMGQRKWFLAKGALEALEVGLAEARLPTTEAHLAAARYYSALREYGKAASEYNLALTLNPGDAVVWAELGALWEAAGRMVPALEAYRQSNVVTPGNAVVLAAIERLTTRVQVIRSGAGLAP